MHEEKQTTPQQRGDCRLTASIQIRSKSLDLANRGGGKKGWRPRHSDWRRSNGTLFYCPPNASRPRPPPARRLFQCVPPSFPTLESRPSYPTQSNQLIARPTDRPGYKCRLREHCNFAFFLVTRHRQTFRIHWHSVKAMPYNFPHD